METSTKKCPLQKGNPIFFNEIDSISLIKEEQTAASFIKGRW